MRAAWRAHVSPWPRLVWGFGASTPAAECAWHSPHGAVRGVAGVEPASLQLPRLACPALDVWTIPAWPQVSDGSRDIGVAAAPGVDGRLMPHARPLDDFGCSYELAPHRQRMSRGRSRGLGGDGGLSIH